MKKDEIDKISLCKLDTLNNYDKKYKEYEEILKNNNENTNNIINMDNKIIELENDLNGFVIDKQI